MKDIKRIRINKNRGWRGLAELVAEDEKRNEVAKMIFSFSQPMWEDMLSGYIVMQDNDNFILLHFDNTDELPKPTQQRSVLIKSFQATVLEQTVYAKEGWRRNITNRNDWNVVYNFTMNKNNHTTSDWNCIGIRVNPFSI